MGTGVVGFARGDMVFGVTNARFTGGYAEYTAASAGMIAHMPGNLSPLDAASVPVVAVTARQMLFDRAGAREGQNVFVHGGAGSVGAYAVQIAKQANMRVWASIYSDGADYVRSLGAENVIDTRASSLKGAAGWADVVIDTVGGASQSQLFDVAKPGGVVVSSAAQPDAAQAKAKGVRAMAFIVNVNATDLANTTCATSTATWRAPACSRTGSMRPSAERGSCSKPAVTDVVNHLGRGAACACQLYADIKKT